MNFKFLLQSVYTQFGIFCALVPMLSIATFAKAEAVGKDTSDQKVTIKFNQDIRPILSDNCFHCHGPDNATREKGLRLDTHEGILSSVEGRPVIVPGKPMESEFYLRLIETDVDKRMPPKASHKHLTPEQINLFKQWILQGAVWEDHWSFMPIVKSDLPVVDNKQWPQNGIDNFIANRLDAESLTPVSKASKLTLIRRVSFDLTGLPPTPEAINAFVSDTSENAYEKLVDRLLASTSYGEHRARYWLDAARYGDTHGLHLDNLRSIWPYRDWVIKAYNDNMPFDDFTVNQLAGDLLPNRTISQHVATGYNRCNPTTSEGGAIDEEYLAIYAKDRVETTTAIWMGLTMGCAACHDHKFDPLSQKEFYQMAAFFRNSTQKAMDGNVLDTAPSIKVPSFDQLARRSEITKALVKTKATIQAQKENNVSAFETWQAQDATLLSATLTHQLPQPTFSMPLNQGQGNLITGTHAKAPWETLLKNKLTWVSGVDGGALSLSNNDDIVVGNYGALAHDKPFSYAFWIKPSRNNLSTEPLFGRTVSGNWEGWSVALDNGKIMMTLASEYKPFQLATNQSLEMNQWYHVLLTYDGAGKPASSFRAFLNGKNVMFKKVVSRFYTVGAKINTDKPLILSGKNKDPRRPMVTKDTKTTHTAISAFYGGDVGEGLDVTGNFVYAVNILGPGGGTLGDAKITPDTVNGFKITSQNNVPDWAQPKYGDTASDDALEDVIKSIRWSSFGNNIDIKLEHIEPGASYKLQLLFTEKTSDRGFNVRVDGTEIVKAFSPNYIAGKKDNKQVGAVITHGFVAKDNVVNVSLGGKKTKRADNNPHISGVLLEKLASQDALFEDVVINTPPADIRKVMPGKAVAISNIALYDHVIKEPAARKMALLPQIKQIVKLPKDKLTDQQRTILYDYYCFTEDRDTKQAFESLWALEEEDRTIMANAAITLVSDEKDTPATANILARGEYTQVGEQVFAQTPAALGTLPEDYPKNRLGLAKWLVSKDHPLTSRVTVNRFWQELFGVGIVESSEDFGSQGTPPSHLPLLDWLAAEFIDSGWNVKHMYKLMAMSATYQQRSDFTESKYSKDRENRLYARGPRFRLDGEVIRDQALYVSGLMNPTIGGPGVKPYQPIGIWKAVGLTDSNTVNFVQDTGDKLYRKSIYTFWKRTAPPPTMAIFDAPSRESCVMRRERTNTPLQALVLMNDPQFLEAARHLAARVLDMATEDKFAAIYQLVLGTTPKANELAALKATYDKVLPMFKADPEAATKMLSVGDSPPHDVKEKAYFASWMVVANQMMNLDAFITKN